MIPLRTLKSLVKSKLGYRTPFIFNRKLTTRCDCRCLHCPFWKRRPVELPVEIEFKLLREAYDLGCSMASFEGGEPLLHPHFLEIIKYAKKVGFHTTCITNGRLLENKINSFCDYVDHIFVSVDGPEHIHDYVRNRRGTYKRAVKGIKASIKTGIETNINYTVLSINCDYFIETVKAMAGLGVSGIAAMPFYLYENTEKALALTVNQLKRFADDGTRLKKEGYPILMSYDYFKILRGERGWRCHPYLIVNIDTNGRLATPCYSLPEFRGQYNVTNKSLETVYRSKLVQSSFDLKHEQCSKCHFHCFIEPSLIMEGSLTAIRSAIRTWVFREIGLRLKTRKSSSSTNSTTHSNVRIYDEVLRTFRFGD